MVPIEYLCIVKVQANPSLKPINIREIFSTCGNIQAIFPSKVSSSSHDSHYFIKFDEQDGADRAVRLNNKSGTRVYSISSNAVLIDEYHSANPAALDKSQLKDLSRGNLQNIPLVDDYLNKPTHTRTAVLVPSTNLPASGHSTDHKSDALWSIHSTSSENPVFTSAFGPSIPSPKVPQATSSRQSLETSPLTYLDPATTTNSITVPCLPLTSHIRICLCGELFSYDLNNLQSDPREIVELLTRAASERGNWMVVGASYRRQGNPHAALAVLNAMLEVMGRHGIPEQELKPAFLLLSSCENDLSKLTLGQGRTNLEHHQKSQKYLQKVYGTMKEDSPLVTHPEPSPTIEARTSEASPATRRPEPSPLTARHQMLGLPIRPRSPISPRPDHREMQSLRDRLQHQTDMLADVSSKKRRLEDFYDAERDTRRKLEREIDVLKRERDDARRMEMRALDQVKREIENRRRAEDSSLRERDLRIEMDRHPKTQRRSPSPYRIRPL